MALPNVFEKEVCDQLVDRLNNLSAVSKAQWGKMDAPKMLAHCNVTYEMIYDKIHPRPNAFVRFMLKAFVKSKVTNEVTYQQNSQTAPAFIIKSDKDFEKEKARLIEFIEKTRALGEQHFDGKESLSFGALNKTEWNNMLYKHLDHHFRQFGV